MKVTRSVNATTLRKSNNRISQFEIEISSFSFFFFAISFIVIFPSHSWLSVIIKATIRQGTNSNTHYLYKLFFNSPLTCLTFHWIVLHMLLKSWLLHIGTVLPRNAIFCIFLCLRLGLFMSYLCGLFFDYHFYFHCN